MVSWPTTADPDHLEQTLSRISPRWTTWCVLTLQQHGHMRPAALGKALPWISGPNIQQQIIRLQQNGLATRIGWGEYQLTAAAHQLGPVYQAINSWARAHIPTSTAIAKAEQIESALALCRGRKTTSVLHHLAQRPTSSFTELQRCIGHPGSVHTRLQRMQTDGLLVRTGRGQYELTAAGRALAPVYQALNTWSSSPSVPAAHRAAPPVVHEEASARAGAARRRTTAAFHGLFSHAPAPEPSVPTAWAAASHSSSHTTIR